MNSSRIWNKKLLEHLIKQKIPWQIRDFKLRQDQKQRFSMFNGKRKTKAWAWQFLWWCFGWKERRKVKPFILYRWRHTSTYQTHKNAKVQGEKKCKFHERNVKVKRNFFSHHFLDDSYMYDDAIATSNYRNIHPHHWYDEPPYESDPDDFLMAGIGPAATIQVITIVAVALLPRHAIIQIFFLTTMCNGYHH